MSESESGEDLEISDILEKFSAAFDKLCQERHELGAKEYGTFTFFENDVVRMMGEELADTANYCRMQFIKLMFLSGMLNKKLDEEGLLEGGTVTIGVESFKGTGQAGW